MTLTVDVIEHRMIGAEAELMYVTHRADFAGKDEQLRILADLIDILERLRDDQIRQEWSNLHADT